MKIGTQKKISTTRMKCEDDPEYNFYQCTEDHYSKLRGCQYPWNINAHSNVKVCSEFSDFSSLHWQWNQNVETGAGREYFKMSEILLEKRKICPPPCFLKEYFVEFETWAWFSLGNSVSLQVALDGVTSYHEEEYFKCDSTCILGELGGNLGFFLGGSILLGLDIVITGFMRLVKFR